MESPTPKTFTQCNPEVLYIMFADLKEYSSNKDNLELIGQMEDALYDIGAAYFNQAEGHCFKVLGDGITATDTDPHAMAQKALNTVKYIQEKFADEEAFTNTPQIRIALHVAEPGELRERHMTFPMSGAEDAMDMFKDIAGGPVINTARIEPIVKPDYVFCSKRFVEHLGEVEDISTSVLGTYELGKKHDKFNVELYALHAPDQEIDVDDLKCHIDGKLDKKEETYSNASSNSQHYQTFMGRDIKDTSFFTKVQEKRPKPGPPQFLKKVLSKPSFLKEKG